MITNAVSRAYFTHLHDVECNQKYNKTLPYSFHLEMVHLQGEKFFHIIEDIINKHYKNKHRQQDLLMGLQHLI